MQIRANGITFNCQVDGPQNAPWIVFSNSLATNLSMWEDQARALSGAFRVLRYDQRGHGRTEAPAGRYSFRTLLDDALALMDAQGADEAHFCGLSLGGATAMGLAVHHSDRIKSAIVCDSPCASSPVSAQQWEERIEAVKKSGLQALIEPTLQRWFPPEVYAANPPALAKVREMVKATPDAGFIGCAAALADHDFRTGAPSVKKPVLFVVGEKDAPNAAMRELHGKVPGSQFVEIAGAGHISNMEQPAAFTGALKAFLKV